MAQSCTRCIYDDAIPYISFDTDGVCNYCRQYDKMNKEYPVNEDGRKKLEEIVAKMKYDGRKSKYDVVIGVSGGCDSSYMLHLAKEMGLRPLAAHFDNTWNSMIAVENIHTMLKKLNIDLFTHVVDNKEYNDIYKSFFKASVPEIDAIADLSLATTHYMACEKFGIKYIWEGHSFRTEGITPLGWVYMDAKYVETIQKQFGTYKIKTLPNLWLRKWLKWIVIDKIKKIRPLYYLDYNKEATKNFLKETYGWQWYGGHHMENRTAYFANNYFLPKKFNIDLRLCEYAGLVRSGQIKREDALDEIKKPLPFDNEILNEVKKRLDFKDNEFEEIMNLPRKSFRDYKTYKQTFETLRPFFWILYKLNYVPKSFYEKFTKKV